MCKFPYLVASGKLTAEHAPALESVLAHYSVAAQRVTPPSGAALTVTDGGLCYCLAPGSCGCGFLPSDAMPVIGVIRAILTTYEVKSAQFIYCVVDDDFRAGPRQLLQATTMPIAAAENALRTHARLQHLVHWQFGREAPPHHALVALAASSSPR